MSDPGKVVQAPEDDAILLASLENYAIEHFPNPQRRGCPSRAVLAKLVDQPSEVTVSDLNGFHVFRCAECTNDLRQLRLERETCRSTISASQRAYSWWWWIAAAAVLILCIAIPIQWHRRSSDLYSLQPYVADVTLGNQSSERGPAVGLQLPKRIVLLHITLPAGEFAETYRVTLAKDRSTIDPVIQAQAPSQVSVSGLQVTVRLDLSKVQSGGYWIGVGNREKPDTWFTFVEVK